MQVFSVASSARLDCIDITDTVQDIVRKSSIEDGLCCVFCPHTTAGITINENADPAVRHDIVSFFSEHIPYRGKYTHTEGNSDAHIKAAVFGSSETVIIHHRRLVLGTWQGIYFCECDGPRKRTVYVQCISGV